MTTTHDADEPVDEGSWGSGERELDPSDSLRTFGAVVQALREHAGLGRAEFGERIRFSKHNVESVELGRRMADEAFVERAEGETGNTGALRKASAHPTRGEPGLAAWFRRWARLEKVAVSLCTYECRLVPGLLQSEGYARAVFDNSLPLLSDEQLEAHLVARLERKNLLRDRPNVAFSFIVEEAALRKRLGGAAVMRACSIMFLSSAHRATSPCKSCRWRPSSTRAWTARCSCWRHRSGDGWRTPRVSRTAG